MFVPQFTTRFFTLSPLENLMEKCFLKSPLFSFRTLFVTPLDSERNRRRVELTWKERKNGKTRVRQYFPSRYLGNVPEQLFQFFPSLPRQSSRDPTFPYRPSISVLLPALLSIGPAPAEEKEGKAERKSSIGSEKLQNAFKRKLKQPTRTTCQTKVTRKKDQENLTHR